MTDVECEHCGYEWTYSGELLYATCPSCRTKTPVEDDSDNEQETPAD